MPIPHLPRERRVALVAAGIALAFAHAGTAAQTVENPLAAPQTAHAGLIDPVGRPAGIARLVEAPGGGIEIDIEVLGLQPGPHGFHVHEHGECAPGPDPQGRTVTFGSAGGHFDPLQTGRHGEPGSPAGHAGDLPNLVAGQDGVARARVQTRSLAIAPGATSVVGRTIVVHERADDHRTDPAGASGGRVVCGVIAPGVAESGDALVGRAVLPGAAVFPEGIAVDAAGSTLYVGSSTQGHIYRLAPKQTEARLFVQGGGPGREGAYGMKVDRHGRLWVAGGPAGTVALYDAASGAGLRVLETPAAPQRFVNDLVVAGDGHVYVTDSKRPLLFRARDAASPEAIALEPWLDLGATPVRMEEGFNLNGIAATPDGRTLIAVQSANGKLWRIDTASREVREILVEGTLLHGDGLVLEGQTLYVIRNRAAEIATVALDPGMTRGKVIHRLTDRRLRFPTTAAWVGGALVVVNGQLDQRGGGKPLLPFDLVRVKVPE